MGPSQEHELAGGNVAGRVARAVATVRKPANRATPAVHALLRHLQASGFDGAPRALGLDDLVPWNLVCDRERWVFIDWDGAGPGSRLWDLAYAAHGFVPLSPGGDPDADAPRLRALVDGCGLDERERHALPPLIEAHTRGMHALPCAAAISGAQPRALARGAARVDAYDPWAPRLA